MEKFCKKCGAELPEGALFCTKCGTAVEIQNNDADSVQSKSHSVLKNGKSKAVIVVSIAAAVAAAAIGLGGILYINSDRYQCKKNMRRAEESYEAKEYEAALFYYKESLKLDNTVAEAYLKTAEIYYERKSYDQTIEVLQSGIDNVADEESKKNLLIKLTEACQTEVKLFFDEGNYEQMEKVLREAGDSSLTGYVVELFRKKSDQYLEEGKCLQAIEILIIGEEKTGAKELSDREAYVRENIIIKKEKETGLDEYDVPIWSDESEYDEQGNQIKWIYYDSNGNIEYWREYIYDESGNQIKCACYYDDGSIDYWYEKEYYDQEILLKQIDYDCNGDMTAWTQWRYDDRGNQTEEIYYSSDGSIWSWIERRYDDRGNQTEEMYHSSDGSIWSRTEWEYDSRNNPTRMIAYNNDGSMRSVAEYEYDEQGNILTYAAKDINGNNVKGENSYDLLGNKLIYTEIGVDSLDAFLPTKCQYTYEYVFTGDI